jgi:hypothetical protein
MVMVSARETGEAFHQKHVAGASEDNDLVFFAMVGLHARACRISEEVMALIARDLASSLGLSLFPDTEVGRRQPATCRKFGVARPLRIDTTGTSEG